MIKYITDSILHFMKDNKIRVLYVHGYRGTPNGHTGAYLKKEIDKIKGLEFVTYSWNLDKSFPDKVFTELANFVYKEKIDIVIGNSMGGYWAASLTDIPKILINPLLDINQLAHRFPKKYKIFEPYNNDLWNNYGPKNNKYVWMCVGEQDELLGTVSYTNIDKIFRKSPKVEKMIIPGAKHKLTENELSHVIKGLIRILIFYPNFRNNIDWLDYSSNNGLE